MKYFLILHSIVLFSISTLAQSINKTDHKAVYLQSLKSGDIYTAISAANYIVASDANSTFKDTLAILYYNANKLGSAYFWANKVLEKNPKNIKMLTVKAGSLKSANQLIPAIDTYTQLYNLSSTAANGYELMNLQYDARRLLECAAVGQEILVKNKIDSNLVVNYTLKDNLKKQTPLKAAILNIYGLALLDLKKTEDAIKVFEQALLIDKNYAVALNNLEVARQNINSGEPKNSNPQTTEKPKEE
jgi:tetratricopeptide (TPR) repeat protein